MVRLPGTSEDDPIARIVKLRFPKEVDFLLCPKPVSPEVAKYLKSVRLFRAELGKLSMSELQERVKVESRLADERRRHEEERARFFNQSSADVDVEHWPRVAVWTLDEAVALSLGKDPRRVNWENVRGLLDLSPFAREYAARRMLIERAKAAGHISQSVRPSVFLAWARQTKIEMPRSLVEAMQRLGIENTDWKTLYLEQVKKTETLLADLERRNEDATQNSTQDVATTSKEKTSDRRLDPRERESLLKLVIGMAVKGYGYRPSQGRNTAVKEIVDDLTLLGLSISDDTVRLYLQEGRELLPRIETE